MPALAYALLAVVRCVGHGICALAGQAVKHRLSRVPPPACFPSPIPLTLSWLGGFLGRSTFRVDIACGVHSPLTFILSRYLCPPFHPLLWSTTPYFSWQNLTKLEHLCYSFYRVKKYLLF